MAGSLLHHQMLPVEVSPSLDILAVTATNAVTVTIGDIGSVPIPLRPGRTAVPQAVLAVADGAQARWVSRRAHAALLTDR